MNYSLFAASKLLQKQSEWDKVAELFSGFVKDKPDNPTVVSALYWIGKAKAHEGKIDEAKQLAADTIKKYIADPNRDAVEQLITQLAQLCVKKKKPEENTAGLAERDSVEAGVAARGYNDPAQSSTVSFLHRLMKDPPRPRRASFSPKPSSAGSGVNRMKKKKTSRKSRASLSRKT